MKPNFSTVEISLSQLKPGMFVLKLDIPWIDSPFIKHKRLIKDLDDIQKLSDAGVKRVLIDIEKGDVPEDDAIDQKTPNKKNNTAKKLQDQPQNANSPSQAIKISLEEERNAALKIRALVMYLAHDVYAAMEGDKQIDKKKVEQLTDLTLKSLKRNENALMNLVHIQQKSRKLTNHAFAVFGLSLNFAIHLKLNEQETNQLAIAALLHEAGWVKLPANLMGKRVEYDETEKQLISQHPTIGVALLEKSKLETEVETIILQHHEHCDGSGFPNGLKKETIHKLARILAICDCYDEWVHQLRDRPGMLPNTAVKFVFQAGEKGLLDKELIHSFISMLGIYPVTSAVQLNTGEKAVVREVNSDALKEPWISIWYDKRGFVLGEEKVIDLSDQNTSGPRRQIEKILDPDNPGDDPAKRLKSVME